MDQQNIFSRLPMKSLTALLIILSLFFVVKVINELRAGKYIGSDVVQSTISVSGEGEVFAIPDIGTFTFGITVERDTVQEAQEEVARIETNALAFLDAQSVDDRDIKTINYNVYPRYEYERQTVTCATFPCSQPPGERVLKGFTVNQTIQVKVRDIETSGMLLSGLGEQNVTNISGLTFSIDDEDALRRDAREDAIRDAQQKAERLADDLDVKLVRIINFFEHGDGPVYRAALDSTAGFGGGIEEQALDAKLPVGENKIVSRVEIVYEIR